MWRRSSVVHVVDELARAQRRERWRLELEGLLVGVAWALWSVRVELALVVAFAGLQRMVGGLLGWIAIGIVVAAALVVRPARLLLLELLHAMHVRRAWARATIDSGLGSPFR